MFDYQKISSDLINGLPDRTKDVIQRRFGLNKNSDISVNSVKIKRESLEAIGKDYGITRERVRQIESDGIKKIKKKLAKHENVYNAFNEKINEFGGFKREDIFLTSLGDEKNLNHVFFLLSIGNSFSRFSENNDFHSFWSKNPSYFNDVKKIVSCFHENLNRERKPIELQTCDNLVSFANNNATISSLEISKHIHQNQEGFLGLKNWPEINPRGIKDKAYLVLKKEEKPLHFTSVAQLMGDSVLPQTVHNELIKDPRFVLIGRGIYALKEWGYEPGEVKDVITRIIKKAGKSLSKKDIVSRVMEQRMVKENTISQNLSNRKHFSRDSEGKYFINEN
jgi:hypothetical protein